MLRYFKTIFINIVPYAITLCAAYLIGSFVNISWNPVDWERDARLVTSIWGITFGGALHTKLFFEGLV
jgi:nitrate reductase gamma subunit